MKIFDAHTHIGFGNEGDFKPLYQVADRLHYDKLNILSCQCEGDLSQNLQVALCKLNHPSTTYGFAGLDYISGRDFLSQVQNIFDMGFDGIKMLEGKPATRKKLKLPLDDAAYDPFYSFLEEKQFPILLHVADPDTFWDKARIPGWATERGWHYDESYVPYSQYYTEVENLLARHPRLHAIFAHFFFLSGDPARVQTFLDNHPNVSIDITAGIEMYENFSKDPVFWHDFFVRNANRIIFGTDSTDAPPPENSEAMLIDQHNEMEIRFLQTDQAFSYYDMELHGLGLPENVREKILYQNFTAYVGETPRSINRELICREAAFLQVFIKDQKEKDIFNRFVQKF